MKKIDAEGGYAMAWQVWLDGQELEPALSASIRKIEVEHELNRSSGFVLEVEDVLEEGRTHWLEQGIFKVGKAVRIALGYADQRRVVFEGKVQNIGASFQVGCAPTLTVEGAHGAYEFLMSLSDTRTFKDKRDSDIVKDIADLAHIDVEVEPT